MKKRELIKVPPKIIGLIIIFLITFFIGLIIYPYEQPNVVGYNTKVKLVIIDAPQRGGGIFINDSLVISSGCKLLYQPQSFAGWATHGPIIDFDTIPHQYTLGDLAVPYELSKKENCDTILVNKDGHELRFLLFKSE